ncbi:MAG: glycosyltransferase [Planctomycetota bacterium]|nr:MAG: glycosyltransferase [Planctomycetota bacterium]RLS59749.1 MAG: glycosyltransferase [Planctomycetota bacterium]
MAIPYVSLIVPVRSEEGNIIPLCGEIKATLDHAGIEWELALIDDGSTDRSWQEIREVVTTDSRIRGLRLRCGFGKSAALSAGIEATSGERIVTLDGDGQDDPAEIPKMLSEIDRGADLVNGWKTPRLDPWHKTWPSLVFNSMVGWLTGLKLHDHNCGLKACRRDVFREVRLYGDMHRFIPVLAAARGFRVVEMPVHHRPRVRGRSKYGAGRFLRGMLDLITVSMLTSYRHRPQHLLGAAGLVIAGLGMVGMTWLSCMWLVGQIDPSLGILPLHQRPALSFSIAAIVVGVQLVSLGLVAELFTATSPRQLDTFSITERVGMPVDCEAIHVSSSIPVSTKSP